MKSAAVVLCALVLTASAAGPTERSSPCYRSIGRFQLSFYCKCRICCGKWAKYHTTTGGVDVGRWKPVVAVDRRVIPLGTQLWIDGVGSRLASDTGSLVKGRKIDILVVGHSNALRLGKKWKEVWVETQ